MVILACSMPNCDFKTVDSSDVIVIAHLTNLNLAHQLVANNDTNATACNNASWNVHASTWEWKCASDALGDALLKVNTVITTQPVDDVMMAMKSVVIIPVSLGVNRAELSVMHQNAD
ncbi:hypothetical protein SK128_000503 [Halocaridina rubra]|uniref:Uncharacterized protein n=1 Tax=Halocaridina rubra TaxID=373956 RepID=A0AAN8ZPQ3_HALRR